MIRFAYLAEDKLYVREAEGAPRLIESTFAQNAVDRGNRDRQRNAWKAGSPGEGFARQMMWNARQIDPAARIVQTTALAANGVELYYAMNIDSMGGLFVYDTKEENERRLLHRKDMRLADLCRHADGTLAMSLQMPDGTANIATLDPGGRGVRELTEGDSIDQAPFWMPGQRRRLLFQSAGVGRNRYGHLAGTGPYAIQQLDLENGELSTVLEEQKSDHLMPKMTADGTLHFIRRPYEPHGGPISPWKLAGDILLFPYRLARALLGFGNFFSLMFSGKPLITAGAPTREPLDRRHLMLFGKLIDAEKALHDAKEGDAPSLVPSSWELVRRAADGTEKTLAKSVLAYDLCPDGGILYTNGSSVFHLEAAGKSQRLCDGTMIEHVAAIGS